MYTNLAASVKRLGACFSEVGVDIVTRRREGEREREGGREGMKGKQ